MRHRFIETTVSCTGRGNRIEGCGESRTRIHTDDLFITRGYTMDGASRFFSWSCPRCGALTDLGTAKTLGPVYGFTPEELAELTARKAPPSNRPRAENKPLCEVCRGGKGDLVTVIGNVVSTRGGGGLIGRRLSATEREVDLPRFTAHPACLADNLSYVLGGGTRFDPCLSERMELAGLFENLGLQLPAAALRAAFRPDGSTLSVVSTLAAAHTTHARTLAGAGELGPARVNEGLALALRALALGYSSRQWGEAAARDFARGMGMASPGGGETPTPPAPLQG